MDTVRIVGFTFNIGLPRLLVLFDEIYNIYTNGKLVKEITYKEGAVNKESFYENGIKVKSIIYYDNKPYGVERIYYFERKNHQNGIL